MLILHRLKFDTAVPNFRHLMVSKMSFRPKYQLNIGLLHSPLLL